MLTLRDLQSEFRQFLVGERPEQLLALVEGARAKPESILAIYRNNTLATLCAALKASFPVVCRLVDERFFDYAAYSFIQDNLPSDPCLAEYGGDFPGFLAGFAPAAGVAFLPDVARLEWAINRVLHAPGPQAPVALASLVNVTGDPAQCRLKMAAASAYIASRYPVDIIWQQHQPGVEPSEVALGGRGAHLEVRVADGLRIADLAPASWAFRRALRDGATLGGAAQVALVISPAFDLALALADVFAAGLVVGVEKGPREGVGDC